MIYVSEKLVSEFCNLLIKRGVLISEKNVKYLLRYSIYKVTFATAF